MGDRVLRVVALAVIASAGLTVIGLIVLWPSGEGKRQATDNASQIGLVTERVDATVVTVNEGRCSYSTPDNPQTCRTLTFELTNGPATASLVSLPEINTTFDQTFPELSVGDGVVLGYEATTDYYFFADLQRRTPLTILAVLFAVVVIALSRVRGALALLAMAATLILLVAFVAPSVLDGNDPLLVAVVAASAIAFVSLYLTHGFTPTTTVALAGTLAALTLTLVISWIFFELATFSGLATEEGLILPFVAENVDLGALLLGGAIIGALGALDDVTVTQVATVAELRHRSPDLPTRSLIASGVRVGRDHIASTVNTLLLAYAGASMPLLLLFAISDQSLATVANSEIIAVEIVRTLCGSIGLVAAVPITTGLAALVLRPEALPRAGDADLDPAAAPPTTPDPAAAPRWEDFAPDDNG